ncbi:MAG: hypothetical protein IJ875_00125, partial [Solobacterium sp.]|nr:hypothetical protein [Solobacterium sp.]
KFLLGALAASLSKEHSLAYLADYPIYGTMADINAFAIGAALIDPQANVYLGWTKTLDANYKQQMEELDIHLYCGADSADASGSLEYGLYRLENGEITNIAAPVINYATYYTKLVELLLQGQLNVHKEKALNYWWGMDAGVLDINMSSRIPYSSRKLVHLFKQGLVSGTLNPFEGELHAQEKVIQGAYGARLSSQEIASMMWLNDNVIGTLPHYNSYDEKTRELLEDQGAFLKEGE